jgi:hypothetical protein
LPPGSTEEIVLRARKGFDYVGTPDKESLEPGNRENTAEHWGIAPFAKLVDEIPASLILDANYLQSSYAERSK